METKKSFKADLKNKRGLLLEMGLIVALALVVYAFAYTPKEYRLKQLTQEYIPTDVELIDVTTNEPVAPKKVEVKVYSQILEIIENDRTIQTEVPVWDADADDIVIPVATVDNEEGVIEDEIFMRVEVMPSFQGGDLDAFREWVMENVKFPQVAQENGIYGRVTLAFVVDKDGRLINIEVLQTPDRLLSEEAIRVLNKSPKWSPGKQRNQPVRVKYTLPVDFRLQN